MKVFYELEDKLCEQLEEMMKGRGRVDSEEAFYITGAIKNIEKYIKMKERGYSGDGDWEAELRGSYGRSSSRRRGYSREGGSSRDGGSYGYSGGYSSYSRGNGGHGKEGMMDRLEHMAGEAPDDRTREMFYKFMEEMRSM